MGKTYKGTSNGAISEGTAITKVEGVFKAQETFSSEYYKQKLRIMNAFTCNFFAVNNTIND